MEETTVGKQNEPQHGTEHYRKDHWRTQNATWGKQASGWLVHLPLVVVFVVVVVIAIIGAACGFQPGIFAGF